MRGRRSRPSCRRGGPVWLLAAAVAAAGLSPGAAGEGPRPPPACAPEGTLLCLDDGRTRVGFDPDRGGALALLVPSAWPDARSLINVHDFGRYAQLSFYAAPDAYDPRRIETGEVVVRGGGEKEGRRSNSNTFCTFCTRTIVKRRTDRLSYSKSTNPAFPRAPLPAPAHS